MNGCAAIIPARAGSKGLPGKNVEVVGGRTLVERAIDTALATPSITRIVVTSDDPRVLESARRAGVEAVDRPSALASDGASIESVIAHALGELERTGPVPDAFVLLQPTSPLRSASTLAAAIELFETSGASGSVYGVLPVEHHPYKMLLVEDGVIAPLRDVADLSAPRQSLPQAVRQSGSLYVASVRRFLEEKTLFLQPVRGIEVGPEEGIDVDTPADLDRVRSVLTDGDRSPLPE